MTTPNNNAAQTLNHVKFLRKLRRIITTKTDTFHGESIIDRFERFQNLKSPALNDEILTLKAYDSRWRQQFQAEQEQIAALLKRENIITVDMQHIGSTAIQHQSSNNVIDMALVVLEPQMTPKVEKTLAAAGYADYGNSPLGPSATWLWKTVTDNVEPDTAFVLHVDDSSNTWFESNVNFCKYMTAHPQARQTYNTFKKNNEHLKKENKLLYSLEKLELVIEISQKADQWALAQHQE